MKKRLKIKWIKRKAGLEKKRKRTRINHTMPDTIETRLDMSARLNVADVAVSECAEIYRSELEYVLRCILERPRIETGGELFGFWKDDGTPVVAYAIGPGPRANHETAFFNQDIDYLTETGTILTGRFGLEHLGEWHSHHQLGLDHPSGHDAMTIAHGIEGRSRNRFLLCIGTCADRKACLGGFLFSRSRGTDYVHVNWRVIGTDSPFRATADKDVELSRILVHPPAIKEIKNGS